MCLIKYHILILCFFIPDSYALHCRTEGGPKEAELKKMYTNCLKMQEGKNSSNNRDYSNGQDWKERGHVKRNDWGRDQMESNNDRMSNTDDREGRREDKGRSNDDRTGYNDRQTNSRDNAVSSRDNLGDRDRHGTDDYSNGRNEFRSEDFGGDMSHQYNGYQSSTIPTRRYKRERDRRTENSGQRSQFNPNSSKKSPGCGDAQKSDDGNSSDNNSTKDEDSKACALHCFLENLEMTGEDGMPDRYLVTHVLTKDVVSEDLKDFLQESIEECFQILDNENTEEKCEFSKNLLMCLSEKGRANCDDWKDDLRF